MCYWRVSDRDVEWFSRHLSLMTNHLLAQGCRRIAAVGTPELPRGSSGTGVLAGSAEAPGGFRKSTLRGTLFDNSGLNVRTVYPPPKKASRDNDVDRFRAEDRARSRMTAAWCSAGSPATRTAGRKLCVTALRQFCQRNFSKARKQHVPSLSAIAFASLARGSVLSSS